MDITQEDLDQLIEASINAHFFLLMDQRVLMEDVSKLTSASIAKIAKTTQQTINKTSDSIEKQGISLKKLKSDAKKIGRKYHKELIKMQKSGVDPEAAGTKFAKLLKTDIKKSFKGALPALKVAWREGSLGEKVFLSILTFVIVIIINTLFFTIVLLFVGNQTTAMTLAAIVCAPLVEESAKAYFAAMKMPWIGTGIVFGIELVMYVVQLANAGLNVGKLIIMRAVGLLMHFSTQAIHVKAAESDKVLLGWVVAVLLHSAFNIVGSAFNKEISALVE